MADSQCRADTIKDWTCCNLGAAGQQRVMSKPTFGSDFVNISVIVKIMLSSDEQHLKPHMG